MSTVEIASLNKKETDVRRTNLSLHQPIILLRGGATCVPLPWICLFVSV
jgi:hypothetical protein